MSVHAPGIDSGSLAAKATSATTRAARSAAEETAARPEVRIRLRDVARAAGVSLSTASRALSGSPLASEQTVTAVRAVADSLGYRPNLAARGLRSRLTGMIGIVVPSIGNPFFAELVEALESALRAADLDMLLTDSRGSVDQERARIEALTDRRVDGVLIVPADRTLSAASLRSVPVGCPVVQIDRKVDGAALDYVGVDNRAGIESVLRHVAQLGARTTSFVSDQRSSSTGDSRLRAFRDYIDRTPAMSVVDVLLGDISLEFGAKAVETLYNRGHRPDAIVCGADVIALGVLRQLHAFGVTVPDDTLVTGFDGVQFAEVSDPTLTTVRQPLEEIAAEAVRLLDARIHGGTNARPHRSEIAPTIVVRSSTSRTPLPQKPNSWSEHPARDQHPGTPG